MRLYFYKIGVIGVKEMSPDIKRTIENATDEFHSKFLWYLDKGMGEPSRRQAIKTIAQLLDRPEGSIQKWVFGRCPTDWKLILAVLETEYGSPPEELVKDKNRNQGKSS
jgi:hypothetical protein